MAFFARFYLAIAVLVTLVIWLVANYVFHAPEGWPRLLVVLGSVVVFVLICLLGNRRQG